MFNSLREWFKARSKGSIRARNWIAKDKHWMDLRVITETEDK